MPDTVATCTFCDILAGRREAVVLHRWSDAIAFLPVERDSSGRSPVNAGHTLLVPLSHFARPEHDPEAFGELCARAAVYAGDAGYDYNLLLNVGPLAGQSIFHVHVHLLPRSSMDGVYMPWDECGCGRRS